MIRRRASSAHRFAGASVYGRPYNGNQTPIPGSLAYTSHIFRGAYTRRVGLSLFIVRAIPSAASGNTERGLPVTRANASVASLIQGAHPSEAVAARFPCYPPTGCIRYTRFYVYGERPARESRRAGCSQTCYSKYTLLSAAVRPTSCTPLYYFLPLGDIGNRAFRSARDGRGGTFGGGRGEEPRGNECGTCGGNDRVRREPPKCSRV